MHSASPPTTTADLAERCRELDTAGYTIIRNALPADRLAEIQAAYDRVMAPQIAAGAYGPAKLITCDRLFERDEAFCYLMDAPAVLPLLRHGIGRDLTLAGYCYGFHKPAGSPSGIGWHNDFAWMVDTPYPRQNHWLRCTWFVRDCAADQGAFTLIPGSHRADGPPPPDLPVDHPDALPIVGRAGDCMVNNTEIWHCNRASTSDQPRDLIMATYKHAWMKPWNDEPPTSAAFADRQTDPLRRQLCDRVVWSCRSEWALD